MVRKVVTISGNVAEQHASVDLEEALDIVGIGWFTIRHALVMSGFLVASLMETTGYAYTLPSARCDLDISNGLRGLLSSMPYFAMVATSHLWGYLGDTRGRRPMLLITSLAAGFFSCASAFMPNLVTFALCKLLGALFIACPSSLSYAYIGEMVPQRWRDTILAIVNVAQFLGSALVPLFAWAILPLDIESYLGTLLFRGWRVLIIAYAAPFLIFTFLLFFSSPESPKFLLSRNRTQEAFVVLQKMYAINKRKKPSEFPATSLKPVEGDNSSETPQTKGVLASIRDQTLPLFQRPLLKHTALMGFLQFGIFATLNGLYMWIPDILNRVLAGSSNGGEQTPCDLILQRISSNVTETVCDDSMATSTFQINSATNTALALISLLLGSSVKLLGKKTLLLGLFAFTSASCYVLNHITNVIGFALLLATLQLTAVGIGPISAYAVQVYPTALRGMAISIIMMLGRSGSAIGANVSGLLLNSACEATFYGYGGLLTICLCLVLLLPSDPPAKKETQDLELPVGLNTDKY